MKIAIVGSRSLNVRDLEQYLPQYISLIISGGAQGVDQSAKAYAQAHDIPLQEFLPDYQQFGRSAPLRRNLQIIDAADCVYIFWDGVSHGTQHVITNCKKAEKPYHIFIPKAVSLPTIPQKENLV